ncbi:MAG TPA: putative toxin-antitoxin system toxin component, PIN family [Candidatus Obscuribacterales bacterium]
MPIKAVLDANIWISALITAGTPKRLVDLWVAEAAFTLVYPQALIDELSEIPSRARLIARVHEDDLQRLIALIEEDGFLVNPKEIPAVSRDPDDDVFLGCALACNADYLVTGDNDLLCLKEHGGIKIVTQR